MPRASWNRPLHLHAVEPGNLAVLLMFHQDRVNRLPEQTQRRPYGCAPLALRQVIAKKKFSLGGWAPTRLQEHNQLVLTYGRPARITASKSASPFLLHSIGTPCCTTIYNIYALQAEARDEPLHPPTFQKPLVHCLLRPLIHPPLLSPNSLDLPHAAYVLLCITKDLGWGPRRRHLAPITVPLFWF